MVETNSNGIITAEYLSSISDRTTRIENELKSLKKSPVPNVSISFKRCSADKWYGSVIGAKDTIFEGYLIPFEVEFPKNYPEFPPRMQLIQPIYHVNIYGKEICMSLLKTGNNSSYYQEDKTTMREIFMGFVTMLSSPNTDDAYSSAAKLDYLNNKVLYNKKVIESLENLNINKNKD
jgi:ubiquitin-protein ligase